MRRSAPLLLLAVLPGCSTAPLAGTLDCLFPSRVRPDDPREPRGDLRTADPFRPPAADRPPDPRPNPSRPEDPFLQPPRLER